MRRDYIHSLKCADRGDFDPLVGFMCKLGARNPSLSSLIGNRFYRPFMQGEVGRSRLRAILNQNGNLNNPELISSAMKVGIMDIIEVLNCR
jgi:hypothetical protein